MKSQSLSISTIVIIVIAVVVLAAVLLFFFGALGKPQSTVNDQNFVAFCNSIAEHIQNSNPVNPSDAENLANSFGFCTKYAQYGNRNCSAVLHPTIHTQDGNCRLSCDVNGAVCS